MACVGVSYHHLWRYLFVSLFCLEIFQPCYGCTFMLLNGWEPMSLEKRAVLADIVVTAKTVATFKDNRTEALTYSADFEIIKVFKGHDTLATVKPKRKLRSLKTSQRRRRKKTKTFEFGDFLNRQTRLSYGSNESPVTSKDKDFVNFKNNQTIHDTNLTSNVLPGENNNAKKDIDTKKQYENLLGLKKKQDKSPKRRKYQNRIYRISNFGDKRMCYADVVSGETYTLLLTVFDGRLSAKYDDIFGAAAEDSLANEEAILSTLGWKPWSSWNSCSQSCGGGIQIRKRLCTKTNQSECDGVTTEQRKCNSFKCQGIKDILKILKMDAFPKGIEKVPGRPRSFNLTTSAFLHMPSSRIWHDTFPKDFSVLMTFNPVLLNQGYVISISNLKGELNFGIQMGSPPVLIHSGFHNSPIQLQGINITSGKWHKMALSIRGHTLSVYLNCVKTLTLSLKKNKGIVPVRNTVTSVGGKFINSRKHEKFVGAVEQLLFIEDPKAVRRQCNRIRKDTSGQGALPVNDEEENDLDIEADTGQPSSVISWSEWTPCSVSCGAGMQYRTPYCGDNGENLEACIIESEDRVQSRSCFAGECPARCRFVCLNGGKCTAPGYCICPFGFYGKTCEYVSCNPGCYNGGQCIEPNKCSCLPGYEGDRCEKARCDPPCMNGGLCVRPGVCSCPYGFIPPDCRPICNTQCYNGGTCVGQNYCKCLPGYGGNLCQTAICEKPCQNGGLCIAPNTCRCEDGYIGDDCSTPTCQPECRNGGTCIYPDCCLCPLGLYGAFCEHFYCSPPCQNGGVCIGLNTCSCPQGYYGKYCETNEPYCPGGCKNNGICMGPHNCNCQAGFTGQNCEKRRCRQRLISEPYTKPQRSLHRQRYQYKCGPWGLQTCTRTRYIYKMEYKTYYRTSYHCQ